MVSLVSGFGRFWWVKILVYTYIYMYDICIYIYIMDYYGFDECVHGFYYGGASLLP